MGKIIQLDERLSNKIAAGEVVERPASVVKELVENALDANSKHIRVDVEEGGLSSIRVLDDGDGLEEEDLERAFMRHATSKIRDDKDLFRIATLGFRGEALPSIASVSKLAMKTCRGEIGHEIRLEGGKIVHKGTTSARKGTEIIVTDLFYNTPARLKYLRTIHTELGHISDCMNRLALAHPTVSFCLTHNGKTLLQTSGNGDLLRVIAAIYGTSVARKMIPIKAETLDFTLVGFVAKPEVTRSNRSYITTIINGRFIRNFRLVKAIEEGYHTLLPIGKHPIVVLQMTMDPILIDVNVHPSKLEVRLSKEKALEDLISTEIKNAFKQTVLIPEVTSREKIEKQKYEQVSLPIIHETKTIFEEKMDDRFPEQKINMEENIIVVNEEKKNDQIKNTYQSSSDLMGNARLDNKVDREGKEIKLPSTNEEKHEDEDINKGGKTIPPLYPIGQLHGTYILAQNEQGLYIIDQHAAQERIKYEYFREKIKEVQPILQDLLVPITFEVTQEEEERLKERGHLLEEVGLYLEPFGTRTYIIRSHPVWFPKGEEEAIISEMMEQLKDREKIDIGKLREDAAIMMSCKAAIKANRHLSNDEIFQLLETLRTCEEPYTCPHGRPIIIHYSTYELEKMFKRIM